MKSKTFKDGEAKVVRSIFTRSGRMNGVTPMETAFEKSRFPKKCSPITPPINRIVSPRIFAKRIVEKELFL